MLYDIGLIILGAALGGCAVFAACLHWLKGDDAREFETLHEVEIERDLAQAEVRRLRAVLDGGTYYPRQVERPMKARRYTTNTERRPFTARNIGRA